MTIHTVNASASPEASPSTSSGLYLNEQTSSNQSGSFAKVAVPILGC
ncbi:hypothetical protein [Spirosoma utsteinense]|uniref:Uncharacterized protein n=1 Tax=Spirosoma utsteinense TaxID=2585773 RepID=A0ABR6WAR7_9BACT|nr:hypothetical protein [Spirosoma utsteinense]MBC3793664.1 hypothetical protein [Spirosoma utsteinense]